MLFILGIWCESEYPGVSLLSDEGQISVSGLEDHARNSISSQGKALG